MGRLIDLDVLMEDMIHCNIGRKSLEEVIKVLNAQPTVKTESKWIPFTMRECDEEGKEAYKGEGYE